VRLAKEAGYDISFKQESLSHAHPNEARIDLFDEEGKVALSVLTFSTGGGTFRIVELDGFPVEIDGSKAMCFICCAESAAERLEEKFKQFDFNYSKQLKKNFALFSFDDLDEKRKEMLHLFCDDPDVKFVRSLPVILPVALKKEADLPFTTVPEAEAYAETNHLQPWELAIAYEKAIGNICEEEIWQKLYALIDVMKNATNPPAEDTPLCGFLPYQSLKMRENSKKRKKVFVGYLDRAADYAIAVMENSCAHNLIVAAPTAGSSGVLPGAILAVGEEMGCTKEEMAKGLLTAGLAGVFIANQATFGAEVAACQAENGSASAMAAAGVVELLGGNIKEAFGAAGLALQNMLGLICDPIGGLTEIPCISRNVSAISNAVLSANMLVSGFDSVIPYGEVIDTMYTVGQQLPAELRCTCKGGLCITPSACKAVERIAK